jgi:hypothetical protein
LGKLLRDIDQAEGIHFCQFSDISNFINLKTPDFLNGCSLTWPEFIYMSAAALSVILSALALVAFAQMCVLWSLHKYVYFGS